MRTVLVATAAFAFGVVLSAAAQDTTPHAAQAGNNQPADNTTTGCGPTAMSAKTNQGITQGGFTDMQQVPKAVVVHAVDPDGNPVIMVLAPAPGP